MPPTRSGKGSNPSGKNGYNNGTCPPDDVLKASLIDYARRQLTIDQKLNHLAKDHGYTIGKSKLKQLNAQFDVPNTRNRKAPFEEAQQKILNEMTDDVNRRRGPTTVKTVLALKGVHVPRSVIRYVMRRADPEGASHRYPGRKNPIPRGVLTAVGTWQEIHLDGHEKLSAAALRMGTVSLAIYGFRDQWSGAILLLLVIPDDRHASCIGHLYLDFIEEFGAIAQKLVIDCGKETGNMIQFQKDLKAQYAPDIDQEKFPACAQIKSVHNTPIESLWHWLQEHEGMNLYSLITYGRDAGFYHPHDNVHVNLFNWLWPPIVQNALNRFADYWNNHVIRYQKEKQMPSGVAPMLLFEDPYAHQGERFSIPIPNGATQALRESLPNTRAEALDFVTPEFNDWAFHIYNEIGAPEVDAHNAWTVFRQMENAIRVRMRLENGDQ
ncbi:hypothetical protein PM082_007510 [Marasmius tenuissimus]|nr:hypothetical protein PM082_007510 [Marasmius tenuissimus]